MGSGKSQLAANSAAAAGQLAPLDQNCNQTINYHFYNCPGQPKPFGGSYSPAGMQGYGNSGYGSGYGYGY